MSEAIDADVLAQFEDEEQARRKEKVLAALEAREFRPPWWLLNGHLQTVWSRFFRAAPEVNFRLERWDTPDDDFIRIHIHDGQPDRPTALLLHGLEGSAESLYILGLTEKLSREGWSVICMEHRSCGGEMNRALRMYHSGDTTDLDFVVHKLVDENPNISLYIGGVSLGGNIAAKWLGQMSEEVPSQVRAGAIVSAPYDLVESANHVDRSIRLLYARHFLHYLIPKAIEKEKQYPGLLDVEAIKRVRTFREFDELATAVLHGFDSAEDYYVKSACGQYLPGVRRPTLLLSADDDPFNPGYTLPRELANESPYLHPLFTPRGGHVGFVMFTRDAGATYWAEEQVVRFFLEYERLLEPASSFTQTP